MAKKKELGAASPEQMAADAVNQYLNLLKEYQNAVFLVLVAVLTVGVLAVWRHQASQEREDAAWIEISKVRDLPLEKIEPSLSKFEGTEAKMFLDLIYAAKLYERGTKPDLLKAKRVLETARDEARGTALVSDLIRRQMAGIDKELNDEKLWAEPAPVKSGS